MVCTFFGHWLTPPEVKPVLRERIIDLIENQGADKFYVGTHGGFDGMCFSVLEELSSKYKIDYKKVLSNIPSKKDELDFFDYSFSVVPEGIENTLPRFRIDYRNRWMIKQSQVVVTYITNPYGSGAAKYAQIAEKQQKAVIKLGKF